MPPAEAFDLEEEEEAEEQSQELTDNKKESSRIECSVCQKILDRNYIHIHMRLHTGERPHKCLGCGKGFIQSYTLMTHMKKVHGTNRFFECDHCQRVFNKKEYLKNHMLIHTGEKPHQCSFCDMHFRLKSTLSSHIQSMHSGKERKVRPPKPPRLPRQKAIKECNICNKVFKNGSNLRLHMMVHTGEKPFECPHCLQRFRQKGNLTKHILWHASGRPLRAFAPKNLNRECEICHKVLSNNQSLRLHMMVHTGEKPHECCFCQKRFRLKCNLAAHVMKMHTPKGPDWKPPRSSSGGSKECQVCKKVLSNNQTLRNHMLIHTGEKPHECLHCPLRFQRRKYLAAHVMNMHTPKGPNGKPPTPRRTSSAESKECQVCKKVFKTGSKLRLHMTVHTEERPFECPHCHFRFKRKENLKEHLLRHASGKPMRALRQTLVNKECQICQKVFKSGASLRLHMPVHTGEKPFECPHCQKRFNQKGNLNKHLLGHTQTVNRECEICHKVLSSNQTLKNHMLTHTGEKPHECLHCQMRFGQKKYLVRHVMKYHTTKGPDWKPPAPRRNRRSSSGESKECQVCKKVFRTLRGLRDHLLIHTGEKPHQCSFCDMRFRQHVHKWRHEQNMHNDAKSFACQICQKVFACESYLKRHTLTHTGEKPHECLHCQARFRQKNSLAIHVKAMHTPKGSDWKSPKPRASRESTNEIDERNSEVSAPRETEPFECPTCHKMFQHRRALIEHQRSHSDDKKFSCPICPMTYKYQESVYRHCKEAHKKSYRKSVAIAPPPPPPPLQNPPASIATLFQKCGVVLERNSFLEDAVTKGYHSDSNSMSS